MPTSTARTPPRRYRTAAPVQARSRETLDRFAEAAEDLLRERPFEDISVQEIARRAGRPIGSFYARFRGKDALLPHLYQRYHDTLEANFDRRLGRHDWNELGFAATVAALVEAMLGLYDDRRWLIRALALFARQRPDALPADLVERRGQVFDGPVRLLLRHASHIAHPDPEAAARFGVFLIFSVAREKILFGEAPHARVTPLTRGELREELGRALIGYLTCGAHS